MLKEHTCLLTRNKETVFSTLIRIFMPGSALRRTLLPAVIGCFVFCSCRKDIEHDADDPPPDDSSYVFMNTGYFWDDSKQAYNAAYWLDTKLHILPVKDGGSGYAYGIETRGTEKYIAGLFTEKENPDKSFPCYWKNGVKHDLPWNRFEPFYNCVAKDLVFWNNKLYILGSADRRPVLWIVSGNSVAEHFFVESAEGTRSGSNIELHNNRLYIAGDKEKPLGAGFEFEVGYWTIDGNSKIAWNVVEEQLRYATAFSVCISEGSVFIAGEKNQTGSVTHDPVINLWNGSGSLNLSPVSDITAYRFGEIHPAGKAEMFMNVWDFKNKRPLLWKVNSQGIVVDKFFPPVKDGTEGYAASIALLNGRLGVAGYYLQNGQYSLWIFRDGVLAEPDLPHRSSVMFSSAKWVLK
jgi:hypothetical protein